MKKWMIGIMISAMVVSLVACYGQTKYKDGIYTAESAEFDDNGWKDVVTVTVENGKIFDVDWNAVNKDGADKKSLSRSGEYDMMAAGAKSQWHDQAAAMEMQLAKDQDPAKLKVNAQGYTDAVSGVTINVRAFTDLSIEALGKAK